MVQTTRAASASFFGPEFNEFLFASIGADRGGGQLSVVSALARLDLDPWAEAANLARMPDESATRKLSALIAALPEIPSARTEPNKIAARLIALLPNHGRSKAPAGTDWPLDHGAVAGRRSAPQSKYFIYLVILISVLFIGLQLYLHFQPSSGTHNDSAAKLYMAAPSENGPK